MKELLYWTWCLPQTLLGFILSKIYKAKPYKNYYVWNNKTGSISLGKYVMIHEYDRDNERTIKHEFGHQKQSFILGWFYLLIIGLPSVLWCNFGENYRKKNNVSYYDFYTESWANKLGKVSR